MIIKNKYKYYKYQAGKWWSKSEEERKKGKEINLEKRLKGLKPIKQYFELNYGKAVGKLLEEIENEYKNIFKDIENEIKTKLKQNDDDSRLSTSPSIYTLYLKAMRKEFHKKIEFKT